MRTLAALVTAWLVSLSGAAAPSAGWALQHMPVPEIADASTAAVSCASADACTAVGSYLDAAGYQVTLAERWDGTLWRVQPTPNPSGGTAVGLSGVSCPSAGMCMAVGSYVNSASVEVTLAEVWNGTSWAILKTPNPGGSPVGSELSAVSCATVTACTATGSGSSGTATLAEAWNGTSWTVGKTPTPPGASPIVLAGVSCPAAGDCIAVGNYDDDTGGWTLAELWNGTTWTIQKTPRPSGQVDSSLAGVPCTGPSACTATGISFTPTQVENTLAERWNGTSWTVQATPNPAGTNRNGLSGVSCSGPQACTAAGFSSGNTLAETWNGTAWTIQQTPSPINGELTGVSCTGSDACIAVGSQVTTTATSLTLAEAWNGTAWAVQASPSPPGATNSTADEVSCSGASACAAVGYSTDSAGNIQPLAEAWDGTSWRTQPTPRTGTGGELTGVSCAGPDVCLAVGYYLTGLGRPMAQADVWNGTSWQLTTVPIPQGSPESNLSGVSCTSTSACLAVGSYLDSTGNEVPLAEAWNGTTWKIVATPSPNGATFSGLSGVSCTSPDACTAVGNSSDGTLAEVWNGTSWTIQITPNPTGATRIELSGVSCTGPGTCTAVGSYNDSTGVATPLAEARSGTTWTIQPIPLPAGAGGGLGAVSCSSGGACTAAGYYLPPGPVNTETALAEVRSGTSWTRQATPAPAGARSTGLSGVSCTGPGACTAVGFGTNATPEMLPLAMTEG